jgi:hypothetical protein
MPDISVTGTKAGPAQDAEEKTALEPDSRGGLVASGPVKRGPNGRSGRSEKHGGRVNGGRVNDALKGRKKAVNRSGIVNGNGLVNGNGPRKRRRERRSSRRRLLLASIALGVIVAGSLSVLVATWPKDRFRMDGEFDDWSGQGAGVREDGGGILRQGIATEGQTTNFFVETAKPLVRGDLVELFIDLDPGAGTGYLIPGSVGAELLVSCLLGADASTECAILSFSGPDREDLTGFSPSGRTHAAYAGTKFEMSLMSLAQGSSAQVRVSTDKAEFPARFQLSLHPAVLVEQQPLPVSGASAGAEVAALRLNVEARAGTGSPVQIDGFEIYVKNAAAAPPAAFAVTPVSEGKRTIDISATPAGDGPVEVEVTSVRTAAPFSVSGRGAAFRAGPTPAQVEIDGLFDDWLEPLKTSAVPDQPDDIPGHLDILRFGGHAQAGDALFYLDVRERVLEGWMSPTLGTRVFGGGTGGLPGEAQPQKGEDIVYVFMDTDGNPLTGFRVGEVGADTLLTTKGRGGRIHDSHRSSYGAAGQLEWKWTREAAVPSAAGHHEMEVAAGLNGIPSKVRLAVRMSDWRGTQDSVDYSMRLMSSGPGSQLKFGAPDGGFDPFAITLGGAFYQSPDGSSWSARTSPAAGAKYVAAAMGTGDLRGYAFVLRSDGKVFVADRATTGWAQYGYGLDPVPGSQAYVGMAAGSGTIEGYIFVLRNDGAVYFTSRAVNGWALYGYGSPAKDASTAYVGIAAGSGTTTGYVFVARADGKVFVSDRGPSGWTQFGYGSPVLPASNAYVGIAADEKGYVYLLRRDGDVRVADRATEGWRQYGYGSPSLPAGSAWTAIAAGRATNDGYIFLLRNDGHVRLADRATAGWSQYGYGSPPIETSTSYVALAAGLEGYVGVLRSDRKMFLTDRGTSGWRQYGYGTPTLTEVSPFTAVAAADLNVVFALRLNGLAYRSGDGGNSWATFGTLPAGVAWASLVANDFDDRVYALANDGSVQRSPTGAASWGAWGDAGTDTSWLGLAADQGGWLYALRRDGQVSYADSTTSTWASKGDVGTDHAWLSIAARSALGHVYVMNADRTVMRSPRGNNPAWTLWSAAPSGGDISWMGIAVDDSYVYALRNDGRVDRAAVAEVASWTGAVGDAGPDTAFVGIATPAAAEALGLAVAAAGVSLVLILSRRSRQKCAHPRT